MDAKEFQDELVEKLIDAFGEDGDHTLIGEEIEEVLTFDDCGFLTRNKGILVVLKNGDSFEMTILHRDHAED